MFDVSPSAGGLDIKPLNPKRKRPSKVAVEETVDEMFLRMKQHQLLTDPKALVTTILVWADITRKLMDRVEVLEAK